MCHLHHWIQSEVSLSGLTVDKKKEKSHDPKLSFPAFIDEFVIYFDGN